MKTRCLLVDDEPLAIQLLRKHFEALETFEVTAVANNAIKALEILNSQEIDLLFLDIKMPKLTGLDFLKTLKDPPKTIITTAYREYALDGYDLDVVDYLLKPITFDRFFKAIERYLRVSDKTAGPTLTVTEETFVYIKSGHKFYKLNTGDIFYIESLKDYIKVYTREKTITTKHKISDIETELTEKGFLRIHRSFLINVANITAFSATHIEVGNFEVPIGANYKEYVFKTLKM